MDGHGVHVGMCMPDRRPSVTPARSPARRPAPLRAGADDDEHGSGDAEAKTEDEIARDRPACQLDRIPDDAGDAGDEGEARGEAAPGSRSMRTSA
jgi:hypothetical protein